MQWLYWLFLGDSKNFHNCSNIIHHHIPFLLLRQRCCCIEHRLRSDIYLKNKGTVREQPQKLQVFCGFAPHCKSVVYDFGGSNPPPSTKIDSIRQDAVFFVLKVVDSKAGSWKQPGGLFQPAWRCRSNANPLPPRECAPFVHAGGTIPPFPGMGTPSPSVPRPQYRRVVRAHPRRVKKGAHSRREITSGYSRQRAGRERI